LKYRILDKSKKFYFTPKKIIWIGAILCFLPFAIQTLIFGDNEEHRITELDVLGFFGTFGFIFAALVNSFLRMNKFQYLQGEFDGELEFRTNEIIIKNKIIPLENISKINLTALDYKGFSIYGSFKANLGDSYKSNGTKNILELNLKNHEINKIYFEQKYKGEIKNDIDSLINYCNHGKLNYLTLLDILQLTDYKEIQNFNKEYLTQFQ